MQRPVLLALTARDVQAAPTYSLRIELAQHLPRRAKTLAVPVDRRD